MRGLVAVATLVAFAGPARADNGLRLSTTVMTAADDDICSLLRSERKDLCRRLSRKSEPSFAAEVFQAGTKRGIRRLVLVVTAGDRKMAGPSVDFLGEDCRDARCVTLESTTPTVRAVHIDGRPGVLLDVVAKFSRDTDAMPESFQTESLVGCAPTEAGLWRCSAVDVGTCTATVGDDGAVATSCGHRASLTVAN
jgi:hypothetical protein